MRSPAWIVDELILALDVYFTLTPRDLVPTNPIIIELSELLRSLPIHKIELGDNKFRNPNGIAMILGNIRRLDPCFTAKSLAHGSKLQKKVWTNYADKKDYLHKVAAAIRNCLPLPFTYNLLPDLAESDFIQGSILYQYHSYVENNLAIVSHLRDRALTRGRLQCSRCGFDFLMTYGDIGEGFMECHHAIDITKYNNMMRIKNSDFPLVCSNCHRMLHRTK